MLIKIRARSADQHPMWWVWVLLGWSLTALVLAVVIGTVLDGAERRGRPVAVQPRTVGAVRATGRRRRQRLPAPAIALTLGLVGLALEALGFLLRVAGLDRGSLRILSMDAPVSVARLFVAALFLAAALAGVYGALRLPQRRTWWLGVALVAGAIASVKAGGTVRTRVLAALGGYEHPLLGMLGSAAVGGVVLAWLFWLCRTERRDRRRVLGALGLYVGASVGLSTVSSIVPAVLTAAATFVEESGESLAGVTVLIAVLAGVAPRSVLPASWLLRRSDDRLTVEFELPAALPCTPPLPN